MAAGWAVFVGQPPELGAAGKPLGLRPADRSYTLFHLPVTTRWSGRFDQPIGYALAEAEGRLALCGYFVGARTAQDEVHVADLLSRTEVRVNGKLLGRATFLRPTPRPLPGQPALASCVQTGLDWTPELARATLALTFPGA